MTPRQLAARMRISLDDVMQGYRKDGRLYLKKAAQAREKGCTVGGFTADELQAIGDDLIARGTDPDFAGEPVLKSILRAHILNKQVKE